MAQLDDRVAILEQQVAALTDVLGKIGGRIGSFSQNMVRLSTATNSTIAEVNMGQTAVLASVLEELIALGVIDRTHLVLVLEAKLEQLETSDTTKLHRLSFAGLLQFLRVSGEPQLK